MSNDTSSCFWADSEHALLDRLQAHRPGLTTLQARERLRTAGPNAVEDSRRTGIAALLLRQYQSPLVLILIFGALVSLLLRDLVDAGIILTIILGSTLLGFYQEYRASVAVEDLKRRLALTCRVLRDGQEQTVPASGIVPGDIILLSAGNLVPADGRVLEARDFLVSEAGLTGESFPVEKRPADLPAETAPVQRTNAVFLGTSVRSGTATVLVVETGRRTAFGGIAARLKARAPENDFARGVRHFGYLLIRVMVGIVLFVILVNHLLGRPMVDSLLFAVALAVGMSPELLPAIVSITLSAGARRMAPRGVIVRRLEAIENLGSMDVLCTDKTGTLTEGVVSLSAAVTAEGADSPQIATLALVNSSLETGIDNPLDAAIVKAGETKGLSIAGFRKIDEIPYDFARKRLTIVTAHDGDTGHLVITKGAVSNVLDICDSLREQNGVVPLDDVARRRLDAYFRDRSIAGYRVLALATRAMPAKTHYGRADEAGMTFEGFLLFLDPPKPDAAKTIADLAALGIRIKVISGDNRHVTAHVAETIGIRNATLLTGADIDRLRDEALWNLAPRTDLFVEVDPQQKERIVRALQKSGHAVGFMGDGINDAPALHAADVGISVDTAVDVARESADIILLKRDLGVLRQGVEDGRRTFANTLKYICITASANFGNMISMALATPLLPFLPLAAKQILLNNFLSDLPSITISTDNVDAERIKGPQRWDIRDIQRFMIVFGLISSVFDLVTFAMLLLVFQVDEPVFQTAWFLISVLTELGVILILRTRRSALRSRPSRLLLAAILVTATTAAALPFLGSLSAAFSFVPLSPTHLAATAVIVCAYLLATELAKLLIYRRRKAKAAG